MDRILTGRRERFLMPEVAARDDFIRAEAQQLPAKSWVLDAGAGSSKYREFFEHCRYETQDFCQYEGPTVKYLQPVTYACDILAIPLQDSCLDAIVCTEVFEHLTDPVGALREFRRLLKPSGVLLLTAPSLSYIHMEPYHYYAGFTRYWYEYWLPRTGFEIVSAKYIGGPGRSFAIFADAFFNSWAQAEPALPPVKRLVSRICRLPFKYPVRYLLPWTVSQFDPWLGSERISSNALVKARAVRQ